MEDSHDFRIDFMELPLDYTQLQNVIPPQLPPPDGVQKSPQRDHLLNKAHSSRGKLRTQTGEVISCEKFHLFAVFDGHGGVKAAEHCTETMAQNLKLQMTQVLRTLCYPSAGLTRRKTVPTHVLLSEPMDGLKDEILTESKEECENVVPSPLPPSKGGREQGWKLENNGLTSEQVKDCLDKAFLKTDAEFDAKSGRDESGTTALLTLVSESVLCVAHCGDCRGVLFRHGGEIVTLTREHSPVNLEEQERITALGGYVITVGRSDIPRVMGVLAMTRSIGDFGLKPYIIPNPETTILRRTVRDEFIVLASDGLWGFLNNSEVCELVNKCFERVESKGLSRHNASKLATHFLIKTAIENGSPDNITVFVIDLRHYH